MNFMENEFDPTNKGEGQGNNQGNQPLVQNRTTPTQPVKSAEKTNELKELVIPNLKDSPNGGASLSDEALSIKEILSKQAKMPLFIPLDPGEKPGAYRSVTINGYRFEVKKGVMVSLPISVAKLLMDAYSIESEVLNNNEYNLANKDDKTRSALNA